MKQAVAAALATILSLSSASAESRAEPPPAYEMKVVYLFDPPEPEILFVIGNSGFRTVESLKNFLASVPQGTKLTWAPGCIRTGKEPLLSSDYEMDEFKRFCLEHGIDFVLIPSG